MRKLFSNAPYGGAVLPCRAIGWYRDDAGVVWRAFAPTGIEMSVWVRLENPKRRTQFCYDAGGGFKATRVKIRKPQEGVKVPPPKYIAVFSGVQ